MATKCLDLLHTSIPNPTEEQIKDYLKRIEPITKEKITLRNEECDRFFKYQKPPKGYKIK